MNYLEKPKSHISESLKLLKIHKIRFLGGVDGGVLLDHFISLEHGLTFLLTFLGVSRNKNLIRRIELLVFTVKEKLYLLRYLAKDESLAMKLEDAYADVGEGLRNVIIKPGTNEYDIIFPKTITVRNVLSETSFFVRGEIEKLLSSGYKADRITPMRKELEDIFILALSLEPFFEYAKPVGQPLTKREEETFATITAVLAKATCFIYLSFVGKMDDEMVLSLKSSLSDLIIEEAQIMEMYFILDSYSFDNLKSHLSMSLGLLEWNKKIYLGKVKGVALEDHFMSLKHGLEFLVEILLISSDIDLTLRIQQTTTIVKQTLYSLPHNQEDENLIVSLEHAYGDLREEMQNVVIKPGTNDYHTLYPEILHTRYSFRVTMDFLLQKIMELVTSNCKAEQIAPIMKELEHLKETMTSLKPLFDIIMKEETILKEDKQKVLAALTTFIDRATCLIYLFFVGKMNEDLLVSVRKLLTFLIEENEIMEMFLALGIICEDLEADIDISLSLLERHEEYSIGTVNEAMLKEHIMSLKHGLDILRWLPEDYMDRASKWRIRVLAGNVKQKLESLTYEQGAKSLNMSVSSIYDDLREQMKNVIINPAINEYDILFSDLNMISYFRRDGDFLLEKIKTLVTTNCKADQVAPLKKELQDLGKILTLFKPLNVYSCGIGPRVLTVHHKAAFLIYLSFIGKMDREMVLLVKSNISTAMEEFNVQEMYTMILTEVLFLDYTERDLYLLENLILLSEGNVESLNEANVKLYEVLVDIHIFVLGLSPNVLSRKLHVLQPSFQAILGHSIPIICSCYLEHTEEDIISELNYVFDKIEHIKYECQAIKLYYFPQVDDLGS